MKIAIMQPIYLAWPGYFNLIASCDVFVFHDDVQFQRSTFDHRNRILRQGRECWLNVPVRHTGSYQRYCEARIDYSQPWRGRHYRALRQAYRKSRYAEDVLSIAEAIRDAGAPVLSELNIALTSHIAGRLGLRSRLIRSSELSIEGKRTERVVALCRRLRASTYLSPPGARQYLSEDGFPGDIALQFQRFVQRPYPQAGTPQFVSHLSIVDLIAQIGFERAGEYVRAQEDFRQ